MGQNWCAKPVSVFGVVQWLGRYRWGLFWLGLSPLLKNTVAPLDHTNELYRN